MNRFADMICLEFGSRGIDEMALFGGWNRQSIDVLQHLSRGPATCDEHFDSGSMKGGSQTAFDTTPLRQERQVLLRYNYGLPSQNARVWLAATSLLFAVLTLEVLGGYLRG